MDLGPVKIKVSLDDTEARRQLEELKKQREKRLGAEESARAKIERPEPIFPESGKLPSEIADSFEFKHLRNVLLPQHIRDRMRQRSIGRYGFRAAQQQAVQPTIVDEMKETMAPVAKTAAAGAAVYGLARIGSTAAYLTMEALKGALPEVLRGSPLWDGLQEQIENLSKAMDNFESRILSMFKAISTTKDIAFASARLGGTMPELQYYWNRSQQIAVQERDLALAFDRFKNKDIASGFGNKIRELTGESMRALFSQSMGK